VITESDKPLGPTRTDKAGVASRFKCLVSVEDRVGLFAREAECNKAQRLDDVAGWGGLVKTLLAGPSQSGELQAATRPPLCALLGSCGVLHGPGPTNFVLRMPWPAPRAETHLLLEDTAGTCPAFFGSIPPTSSVLLQLLSAKVLAFTGKRLESKGKGVSASVRPPSRKLEGAPKGYIRYTSSPPCFQRQAQSLGVPIPTFARFVGATRRRQVTHLSLMPIF